MACCELHITSKGKDYKCLYDKEDRDLVQQYRWYVAKGYARANHLYMHRLILRVSDPKIEVDHVDHNTLNNQRSNLRLCSHSENQRNKKKYKGISSYKGVSKEKGRFRATININNTKIELGTYRAERTAARVYDIACKKLHGEFAVTNFNKVEKDPIQLDFIFKNEVIAHKASFLLIEKATKEGWIKQLAFYHLLKFRFNNGCIYDYRSRKKELAELLEISIKTLNTYLSKIKDVGLAKDHSSNLRLKSITDINSRYRKCTIIVRTEYSLFDITCLLYCKLIERKAKQLSFIESVRRFGRGDRLNGGSCENPFLPSLSYRTIAKLIFTRESKSFYVMKNLSRLGVIRLHRQKPKFISSGFTDLHYIDDLPGYRFIKGDRMYEQFGSKIEFLQFPVFLKRISVSQYKRFIYNKM